MMLFVEYSKAPKDFGVFLGVSIVNIVGVVFSKSRVRVIEEQVRYHNYTT